MIDQTSEAHHEAVRLAALDDLQILDTTAEQAYDDIAELAAFICGTPVSLVSLIGKDRQFFKSAHNVTVTETPRDQSFCAHTLPTAQTLVVEDATQDERFAQNPLVTGDPHVRFYAGAPIVSSEGHVFGTVCVIDSVPRSLTREQLDALERLARQASNLLNRRALSIRTTKLEAEAIAAAERAEKQRERLQHSLDAADVASWFYDPLRNVISGDARMGRLFGLEAAEAPAEVWIEAIFEPDRLRVSEAFAAGLAGAPYDVKFRIVVDGDLRWLHSRAKSTPQLDGSVRMAGICEDVTWAETLAAELAETEARLQRERQVAADRLHLERERLQLSLSTSNATSFDWTPATDEVRWTGLPPFGVNPAMIPTGTSSLEYVLAPDRLRLTEVLTKAMADGHPYDHEYRARWANGSTRWVRTAGRAIQDVDGTTRFLGVNTDITERKAADAAMLDVVQESERRLRLFVESLPVLAWIANADGWITWYNRRWYDYTGTTPQQMEGWGWQSVHDPEVLPEVMERWTASIRTGKNFEMIFPLRGADEVYRPFLTRIEPLRDEGGVIIQWFGTNVEVDALQKTQRALERSEAVLTQVLTATNDAVLTISHRWTLIYSNPKAAELYGLQDGCIGQNIWHVLPSIVYAQSPFVECFHRAMEQKEVGRFEAEFGPPSNFVVGAEVYPSEDGIVCFSRDITKLKNATAAVLQSEKLAAVGRLASSIAHEINNPLEAVTNLLYIARNVDDLEVSRGYLANADVELRRVAAIANQTLRFHRQSTRATEATFGVLIENLFRGFHSRLNNSRIEVRERNLCSKPVLCLEGEIRQVLVNLVSNAIDAMHGRGGVLYVRGRDGRDWKTGQEGMVVTIADTGEGISERTQARIFEAFYTTKGIGGTGLGLWVSKEIIDRHQGVLSFRTSQRINASGSVFRLFLRRRMDTLTSVSD